MQEEQIRSLIITNNYYEDRVNKMESMVKQKSNYFQKKLLKVKCEHKENIELEEIRKSVHQLQSNRNCEDDEFDTEWKFEKEQESSIDKHLKKRKLRLKKPIMNKKIRFENQEDREDYSKTSIKASNPSKNSLPFIPSLKVINSLALEHQIYNIYCNSSCNQ